MYDISDKPHAIREVQRFLLELHYAEPRIPFVTADGIYGPDTRAAVLAYQRLSGLPESGSVDLTTWNRLFCDFNDTSAARRSRNRIPPDTRLPVTIGAKGTGVRSLQHLMNALAERYALPTRTDVSGVYSYASSVLANALRRIYRMKEDGSVNGILFEKMIRDYGYPMQSAE